MNETIGTVAISLAAIGEFRVQPWFGLLSSEERTNLMVINLER